MTPQECILCCFKLKRHGNGFAEYLDSSKSLTLAAGELWNALKSYPTLQGQRKLRLSAFDGLLIISGLSGHDTLLTSLPS